MPISKYDKFYGSKKGSATKALDQMRERYGPEKGTRVFYALANKKRSEGKVKSKYDPAD